MQGKRDQARFAAIGKQGRFGTADDPTNQDRWMSDLGRIALTKSEGTDANKGRP